MIKVHNLIKADIEKIIKEAQNKLDIILKSIKNKGYAIIKDYNKMNNIQKELIIDLICKKNRFGTFYFKNKTCKK
jgi:hypothetical protein